MDVLGLLMNHSSLDSSSFAEAENVGSLRSFQKNRINQCHPAITWQKMNGEIESL